MIIDGDKIKASSGNTIFIPTGYILKGTDNASIYSPGSIIQVQSTTKTDTFSTSSTTHVDITGLSVAITPKFTTSKILVMVIVSIGRGGDIRVAGRLTRNSTAIGIGDASSTRDRSSIGSYYGSSATTSHFTTLTINFLDSPASISALTYIMQIKSDGANAVWINRESADSDSPNTPRAISTITVMEVAQ